MIGFYLVNLLIPEEPTELKIKTNNGEWLFEKQNSYERTKDAISKGQCGNTYSIENSISLEDGAEKHDLIFEEMTAILLGSSYLTALAVTSRMSTSFSDSAIVQPSQYWPRPRSMGIGNPCVKNHIEFQNLLEKFVNNWSSIEEGEKTRLLIHHWLDSLSFWSFEDFYLSATTLLQIIAETQRVRDSEEYSFFKAIKKASKFVNIRELSYDFIALRNNLIHKGKLLGGDFRGRDLEDCAKVAKDVMNWLDEYIHYIFCLGSIKKKRFDLNTFRFLNSFSI